MLEVTLNEVRRKGLDKGLDQLEITIKDQIIRIPLERIYNLALVSEH